MVTSAVTTNEQLYISEEIDSMKRSGLNMKCLTYPLGFR